VPIRPMINEAGVANASGSAAAIGAGGPPPLDIPTYKRAAYDLLRDMIVWFDIAPGQRLVESELAGRLGVSKTPVREALALLEADGLVESTPYRGASVRWLTVTEMEEQAFLVDALEVPAFPLVVEHITRAEIAEVAGLVEQLKQARRAGDQRGYGKTLVVMHGALFEPTGFPRLRSLIATVVGPAGLRYDSALVYPFADAWDLHLRLTVGRFEALRRRDAEGAQAVVRRIRAELTELARSRMDTPAVARYFKAS
jgi:DNA-binding GntR family transcriptional regulator